MTEVKKDNNHSEIIIIDKDKFTEEESAAYMCFIDEIVNIIQSYKSIDTLDKQAKR